MTTTRLAGRQLPDGVGSFLIQASSDDTTSLTVATIRTIHAPYSLRLVSFRASVVVAPVGADLVIDIKVNNTSIFTSFSKLVIDDGTYTSTGSSLPYAFSAAFIAAGYKIADDDKVQIEVTQIGSSVAGAGLQIAFKGWLTS